MYHCSPSIIYMRNKLKGVDSENAAYKQTLLNYSVSLTLTSIMKQVITIISPGENN